METYPNKRELSALRELDYFEPQRWAFANIGATTRTSLLGKGWIKEFRHPVTNESVYQTTDCGRAAMQRGLLPKAKRLQPRLHQAPPRIAVFKGRFG